MPKRTDDGGLDLQPEFMWKDADSSTTNCPALSRADYQGQSGYVVQGKYLTPETLQRLRQLGDDETGVWVPANVLDRLKDEL